MKKVFLLEGSWFYCRDAINKIKDGIGENELYSFDSKCSYEYVKQTIMELSWDGCRKLIIVNDLPKVKAPTKSQAKTKVTKYFQKLIPSIPKGTVVVFNDCISNRNKSFKSVVDEYGKVYSSVKKMSKNESARFVVNFFEGINKSISFEDAFIVANSLNLDASEVDLDNLILLTYQIRDYVGGRKKISNDDVLLVCNQSREFIIWSLLNLFDEKDFCSSMELLNIMLDSAKGVRGEIEHVMGTIRWKYSLLLMIKNGLAHKMSREDITNKLLKFNKLERSGKGKNIKMSMKIEKEKSVPAYTRWGINAIFDGRDGRKPSLSCYTHKQLILINYAINKAITKIRSGCTDNELLIQIEFVFMTICGKIKKVESLRILESKNLVTLEDYYDLSV